MRETLLSGIELVNGDCAAELPGLPAADLILTSPPYDGLREYGGYNAAFDFGRVAAACAANLAPGGVLVWVVGNQIIDGGESGTSFRHALGFMDLGLRLHQTLIYYKWTLAGMTPTAYYRTHEYMFVFTKGKPKTANLLKDRKNVAGGQSKPRNATGNTKDKPPDWADERFTIGEYGRRGSVWKYRNAVYADNPIADLDYNELKMHPAKFPRQLARDHILSWTNPGDLVIDPMAGSGTSLRASADLGRRAIGVEVNPGYCALIRRRLAQSVLEMVC